MPDLLAAAGGIAAAGIDAWATGAQNKKSRAFATQMYERQKYDNLQFWNMQNAYNSPEAQMQRFTDAGLNPALIYGQQNTAGPLTSPDVQKPEFNAPQPGQSAMSGVLSILDATSNLEMKGAQTDNLKYQADILKQEALLKSAQTQDAIASYKRKMFDLNFESELYSTSVEARKEALRQTKVNIDLAMRKDLRESLQTASSINEALDRLKTSSLNRQGMRISQAKDKAEYLRIKKDTQRIQQNIEMLKKDNIIRELDVELSKKGIRPGDPLWFRVVGTVIEGLLNQFGITESSIFGDDAK